MSLQSIALDYVDTQSDQAFEKLYNILAPKLKYRAKKFLINYDKTEGINDRVEDVVSTVFFKIIKKLYQYNKLFCFSTWAFKICDNELLAERKRILKCISLSSLTLNKKQSNNYDNYEEYYLNKNALSNDDVRVSYNYLEQEEEIKESEIFYDEVLTAILMLPEKYKSIFIDREIHDMTYNELTIKYKLELNTTKSRLFNAKKLIRKQLKTRRSNM